MYIVYDMSKCTTGDPALDKVVEEALRAEKVKKIKHVTAFLHDVAMDIWDGNSNAESATFTVDITPTGASCRVAHYTEKK